MLGSTEAQEKCLHAFLSKVEIKACKVASDRRFFLSFVKARVSKFTDKIFQILIFNWNLNQKN